MNDSPLPTTPKTGARIGSVPSGVTTPERLETVSLFEAVAIVGTLRDILIENPPKLLEVFTADEEVAHPLRNILRPMPDKKRATWCPGTASAGDALEERTFQDNVYVYAKFDPFPLSGGQMEVNKKLGIVNPQVREYFLAKVVSYDAATGLYLVDWANGKEARKGACLHKKESELIPAGSRDKTSGPDRILYLHGQKSSAALKTVLAVATLIFISTACLQVYANFFVRVPDHCPHCRELAAVLARNSTMMRSETLRADVLCEATCFLKWPGAFIVGMISFVFSSAGYFVVLPLLFRLLRYRFKSSALRIRWFMTVVIKDAMIISMLPNLSGFSEEIMIVTYVALGLSCLVLTVGAGDSGLLALGALATANIMRVGNIFGESVAIMKLREQQFLHVAEALLEKLPIDISREQLKTEVALFLNHPPAADVMSLSVEMLVLLVAGTRIPKPDSVRVRRFIVREAYLSDYTDPPGQKSPSGFGKSRDIIVDLFDDTLEVPGINLNAKTERFISEGARLPFFAALRQDALTEVETDLRRLGLPPGHGAFTWRCNKSGKWLAHEAKDIEVLDGYADNVVGHYRALNTAFVGIAKSDNNIEKMHALLAAGADVNYVRPGGMTALLQSAKYGQLDTVHLLLGRRAEPNTRKENTGETPLLASVEEGHLEVFRALLRAKARADHTHDKHGTALDLARKHNRLDFTIILEELEARSLEAGISTGFQGMDSEETAEAAKAQSPKAQDVAAEAPASEDCPVAAECAQLREDNLRLSMQVAKLEQRAVESDERMQRMEELLASLTKRPDAQDT